GGEVGETEAATAGACVEVLLDDACGLGGLLTEQGCQSAGDGEVLSEVVSAVQFRLAPHLQPGGAFGVGFDTPPGEGRNRVGAHQGACVDADANGEEEGMGLMGLWLFPGGCGSGTHQQGRQFAVLLRTGGSVVGPGGTDKVGQDGAGGVVGRGGGESEDEQD